MMIRAIRGLWFSCALILSAAMLLPAAPQQNLPAPASTARPAAKKKISGLPNFGVVSETLFRGAQPKKAGYAALKKQGIGIVVSFRDDPRQIADERRAVEELGLRFVSIPWSVREAPRNAQVAEFLLLLRENYGQKVFVHCQRGADRTGVMIAAYRIAGERWAPQEALVEMDIFGFHKFWLRGFKDYVISFPKQLGSDPVFRPLSTLTK
jgi:tyrosine-protein phosphatase SIW14